jgi:hypothetical protein
VAVDDARVGRVHAERDLNDIKHAQLTQARSSKATVPYHDRSHSFKSSPEHYCGCRSLRIGNTTMKL